DDPAGSRTQRCSDSRALVSETPVRVDRGADSFKWLGAADHRRRASNLVISSLRSIRLLAFCVAAALASRSVASASATKIWLSDSASEFSGGEARGVAVETEGALRLSREARRVEGISEASVFAAVHDRDGSVLLATGDSGRVLKVSPSGKAETL